MCNIALGATGVGVGDGIVVCTGVSTEARGEGIGDDKTSRGLHCDQLFLSRRNLPVATLVSQQRDVFVIMTAARSPL